MITFGDGTPTALFFGDGTPVAGFLGDGTPITGPPVADPVEFTTTGATFTPEIELAPGSSAVVTWQTTTGTILATGPTPSISFGSATTRTVQLHCTAYGDIVSLNLGFDHTQDAGREGPDAGYDKDPEDVTGVTSLTSLTGLQQFMAANTALTGPLDATGLADLLFIECFQAKLTSVTLGGCTSLIRLCLEDNLIDQFDLNPVTGNLRDLRAAIQHGGLSAHTLDFVPLDSPMVQLWHYCVRDQTVTRMIPHSLLPVVEQHWTWQTGQTTSDSPTSTVLRSYQSNDNAYDQASVNRVLIALDTIMPTGGGEAFLAGAGSPPSGAGLTARANLISRGWNVTTN